MTSSDASRWVKSLHPGHTRHKWGNVASRGRESWFDDEYIACGAVPEASGVDYAFLARQRLGEEAGQRFLSEFHAALRRPPDELRQHVQQMPLDIAPATAD